MELKTFQVATVTMPNRTNKIKFTIKPGQALEKCNKSTLTKEQYKKTSYVFVIRI